MILGTAISDTHAQDARARSRSARRGHAGVQVAAHVASVVLTLTIVVAGVAATASAQDVLPEFQLQAPDGGLEDGEALLGVIETPPARLMPRSYATESETRTPDQLFDAALAAMKLASFDEAQRLFEIFVARDPRHPQADEARRQLSELYQRESIGRPSTASSIETTGSTNSLPPESAVVAAPALPPAPKPLRTPPARWVAATIPVGGRLENSFMLSAGDRVFFSARSAELGARARTVLAAQARWLKRHPHLSAVIEGHADDETLSAEDLDRLSAERAQAVYDRLIEEGLAPSRLAIAPLGRAKPVALCASALCAAQNRRAVTVVTPQRLSDVPDLVGDGRSADASR